jgi:hypothetical protein
VYGGTSQVCCSCSFHGAGGQHVCPYGQEGSACAAGVARNGATTHATAATTLFTQTDKKAWQRAHFPLHYRMLLGIPSVMASYLSDRLLAP